MTLHGLKGHPLLLDWMRLDSGSFWRNGENACESDSVTVALGCALLSMLCRLGVRRLAATMVATFLKGQLRLTPTSHMTRVTISCRTEPKAYLASCHRTLQPPVFLAVAAPDAKHDKHQ